MALAGALAGGGVLGSWDVRVDSEPLRRKKQACGYLGYFLAEDWGRKRPLQVSSVDHY